MYQYITMVTQTIGMSWDPKTTAYTHIDSYTFSSFNSRIYMYMYSRTFAAQM